MSSPKPALLCQYHYDPLDRLTGHTQSEVPNRQRFYCRSRLATEIQGAIGLSIVQHDDFLLAQQQCQENALDTTLLATDLQRSVLQTINPNQLQAIAYSPYGHRPPESGLSSLLGFNGERRDPVTGCYLLGNGYRAFNPVLMRFSSPDSLSPFGKGGINCYAYCLGDPVNNSDRSGHSVSTISALARAKIMARNLRIKKILPNRKQITPPHYSMSPVERLKASDEYLEFKESFNKIHEHQNKVFTLDYNNRKTPNLKNLSAGVIQQKNLPINDLPLTLQKFAKTPYLPNSASDLLETIKTPANSDRSFDINLVEWHEALQHSSGRTINKETVIAYSNRINHVVENIREQTREGLFGLLDRVSGRVYHG